MATILSEVHVASVLPIPSTTPILAFAEKYADSMRSTHPHKGAVSALMDTTSSKVHANNVRSTQSSTPGKDSAAPFVVLMSSTASPLRNASVSMDTLW